MSDGEHVTIGPGSVIDDFEILEQIGRGGFSHVHIARHIPTDNYCAAKVVELTTMGPDEFTGMLREVSVFMQVDHPNICNLYRLSVAGENLIFFMEFATRGTLLDYVNSKGGLNEFEAQHLFVQIFAALRHLHVYHFLVHRDMKLENVLLDAKGNVKLTDFGLSGTYYNNLMRTFVGTPGYQPPEILGGSEYNEKCDVWSLGVCLYAMMTANLPFSTQTVCCRSLVDEATSFVYPPTFSPALVDLLKKMFEVRPADRPSLMQLQGHPWLRGLQQLGANIAPQPIMFYKVNNTQGILKFKRRSIKADPAVLEQCEGVDPEELANDLKNGVSNANTTLYFFKLRPLATKPVMKPPELKRPPPIPGTRKRDKDTPSRESVPELSPRMPTAQPRIRERKGSMMLPKTPMAPLALAKEPKVMKPLRDSNRSSPALVGTPARVHRKSVGPLARKLLPQL